MKTKRIKIPIQILRNRDDAESAMNDLANAANNKRKLLAQRDAEILALNTRFEQPLAAIDLDLQSRSDALRVWAEANPDQFPKDRKSLTMTSGTLGFRTGTPKLALLSRAWNWEKVLATILNLSAWAKVYVRTKQEVDKDAILGNYSQAADKAGFQSEIARVGVKVTQDESFFIDPDLAQFDPRQTSEAA